jgi:ABC-type protease/lipase transport system fused ATPase/permease subunit
LLIVLDEPNSNLDTEGDEALTRAIRGARERGAIVPAGTRRRPRASDYKGRLQLD